MNKKKKEKKRNKRNKKGKEKIDRKIWSPIISFLKLPSGVYLVLCDSNYLKEMLELRDS